MDKNTVTLYDFVKESNTIEGIHREPTSEEITELDRFVLLEAITPSEIERFISVYQPDAKLRSKEGMNVTVGLHRPPSGGELIMELLEDLLIIHSHKMSPYQLHVDYEKLHPFTDCNGRSGRALWAWHMNKLGKNITLPFLHHFYYQSLDSSRP